MELLTTAALFVVLLASAVTGSLAQPHLRERHVTRETTDSVRLLMGMLLTFSAIVLGLLTSTAKEIHDGFNRDLSAYSGELIELDHRLRSYGPGADDIRASLRAYTAAAVADTWPGEPAPAGRYPRFAQTTSGSGIEGTQLGDLLSDIDVRIERLNPSDPFHQQIAARLRARVVAVIEHRWQLILAAHPTIAWPFLLILAAWLAVIFAIFGLTAPRNLLIYAVVGLSALSIASPLYLILDYGDTRGGHLSSAPLRFALRHMDAPTPP